MFDVWDHLIVFTTLIMFGAAGYYYGPYKKSKAAEAARPVSGSSSGRVRGSARVHLRTVDSFSNLQSTERRPYVSNVISLFMNYISATAVLGVPAVIYNYGVQYWATVFAIPLAILVVDSLFVEVFYMNRVLTPFEYLEKRFGFRMRATVFGMYIVQSMLLASLALYLPAKTFAQLSGIDFNWCMAMLALVVITYTAVGGLKAVVHLGTIQAALLVGSMVTITGRGLYEAGGSTAVYDATHRYPRSLELFNLDPSFVDNRVTLTSILIGSTIHWVSIYGCYQATLSRYIEMSDLTTARKVIRWQMVLMPLFYSLMVVAGLVVFTFFVNCDPLTSGIINSGEQLLPYFVEQVRFPTLEGMFTVGVLSAALSSMAASLNSLSYGLVFDLINPLLAQQEGSLIRPPVIVDHSRSIAAAIGIVAVGITAASQKLSGVLKLRSIIYSVMGAPSLGVFLLGLMNPWCETSGAASGYGAGLTWGLYLTINHYAHRPPYYPILVHDKNCLGPLENVTATITTGARAMNLDGFDWTTTTTTSASNATRIISNFLLENSSLIMSDMSDATNGTVSGDEDDPQQVDAGIGDDPLIDPKYIAEWKRLPFIQRTNTQYFGASCLFVTLLVGCVVSYFRRPARPVGRHLLSPFVKRLVIRYVDQKEDGTRT